MNVPEGFTDGFSFYYSTHTAGSVEVYDGLNGAGKLIATLSLKSLPVLGKGDPNGAYDNWKLSTVSFSGTAKSVNFSGAINGIAFDNITLGPAPPIDVFGFQYKLNSISRKHGSTRSDGFSIWLEDFKPRDMARTICERYSFKVTEKGKSRAASKQTGCEYNPKSDVLRVDFDIPGSGRSHYFENGVVYACVKGGEDCEELKAIQDFSVYGTGFDLSRDAFSFKNGAWGSLAHRRAAKGVNDFGHAIETIADFLPDKKRGDFWDSVGYTEEKDVYYFLDRKNQPDGLCYGMAVASIAQFNHRQDRNAWGIGGNYQDEWRKQIEGHWDNSEVKAVPPFKPFDTDNVHKEFDRKSVEALKKIAYHYAGHPFFSPLFESASRDRNPQSNWVGNDSEWTFRGSRWESSKWNIDSTEDKERMVNTIKSGSPLQVTFRFIHRWYQRIIERKGKYGVHAVAATQVIRYHDKEIWYMYDNNYPDQYTCLPVNYTESGKAERIIYLECGKNVEAEGKEEYVIDRFYSEIGEMDRQNIYAMADTTSSPKSIKQKAASPRAAAVEPKTPLSYLQPLHLKVQLVGAEVTRVRANSDKQVTTLPITSPVLEPDSAYRIANSFGESLYLPRGAICEIEIRRFSNDFPFKVFGTITDESGNVTVMNFEPERAPVGPGQKATLLVDGPASTIAIKGRRKSYAPDFKEAYPLSVPPVQSVKAITLDNQVILAWDNPAFPNLASIRVIRKKGSAPKSPSDGTLVFFGLADQFPEYGLGSKDTYHYALFAVSTDSRYSEPAFITVNLDRYSIYGKLFDAGTNTPIRHANVELLTADKSRIVDISSTNNKGLYSFNGLTNGTYWLRFLSGVGESTSTDHKVIVNDQTLRVDNIYISTKPFIRLAVSREIMLDDVTRISWDGKGLEGERVNITLTRNGQEETIASNIRAGQRYYDWRALGSMDDAAQLRISLVSSPEIYDEKGVSLVRNRSISKSSASKGGGGGGGAIGLFLLALLFASVSFHLYRQRAGAVLEETGCIHRG